MKYGKLPIIVVLLFGLLLFGCLGQGQQPATQPTKNDTGNATVAKRPSFEILSPLDVEVIKTTGESVDVTVTLSSANVLLKPAGDKVKSGEGHFHLTLDGNEVMTAKKEYTFEKVALGEHTLKVEIKQNDHSSYVPKIMKTITFTVEKESAEPVYKTYDVSIQNFAFSPAEITINVGDSVKWTNNDQMPHTAKSTGNFDTGTISSGTSGTVTFTKEGTYEYICGIHPYMTGKVIVVKKQ